jgi:hypothetical protein
LPAWKVIASGTESYLRTQYTLRLPSGNPCTLHHQVIVQKKIALEFQNDMFALTESPPRSLAAKQIRRDVIASRPALKYDARRQLLVQPFRLPQHLGALSQDRSPSG